LPWQLNFEKNCTDCRHTEKYKNLIFITVTLLMLKKQQKSIWSFAYRGIKHGDFCCFEGVTYVALTLCFKLRSFLHWFR